MFLSLFAVSCNQDEQNTKVPSTNDEASEISKLETAEGTMFYKRDIIFQEGGNEVVLTLATRNVDIFNNVVKNFKIEIVPIVNTEELITNSLESIPSKSTPIVGEEIMAEFTKMVRAPGVIGYKTNYFVENNAFENGKVDLSGYDSYVNHYSNHWPSTFNITFQGQGGGVHFYARWRWYQGYGSRTVCLGTDCRQEFDLPGNAAYLFNVDGPYQIEVTIGSYSNSNFSYSWTY